MGFAERPQPALDQRGIDQDPAVEGGVVHLQTALPEQLLDVAVAQGIAQVPGDGLQDQRCLKMATLEVGLGLALQLLDKGIQDHGPPPVRRQQSRPVWLTSRERQKFATGPLAATASRSSTYSGTRSWPSACPSATSTATSCPVGRMVNE